jgi:osomolarity two-component system response regulator SSK1
MSANMASLNAPISSRLRESFNQTTISEGSCSSISNTPLQASQVSMHDFDIGENLQSAGDALGGMAADLGVDLVLFHGDVGMKHIAVKGDEIGISYTLSHVSQYSPYLLSVLIFFRPDCTSNPRYSSSR